MGVEAEEFVAELLGHFQPETGHGGGGQAGRRIFQRVWVDAGPVEHRSQPRRLVAQVARSRQYEISRYRIVLAHGPLSEFPSAGPKGADDSASGAIAAPAVAKTGGQRRAVWA
ncbi:hypothetical protein D9M70_619690 [compost metagenome]